jgi:hypothetical protein
MFLRVSLFFFIVGLLVGCGGGGVGGGVFGQRELHGQLSDSDVRILDDQLMDPYNFEARGGVATARLNTFDMTGLLRIHDTEGNLIAQSIADQRFQATVTFDTQAGMIYSILVVGATSLDRGAYVLRYSENLVYQSQVK